MEFQGLVVKSTGSWYNVLSDKGVLFQTRLKGKMRLAGMDTANPLSVGDKVICEGNIDDIDNITIKALLPRKNYIIRKSNKLSKQRQVLAANLDLAIMVASVVAPSTSNGFIDRFLLCAEAFHVPVLLFFNKVDLLDDSSMDFLQYNIDIYNETGIETLAGSLKNNDTISYIKELCEGKTVLLAGHSGVGKSTLLNALLPGLSTKTSEVSKLHLRGKHTTTFAEMHFGELGTRIIDTPGIRDFGVVDLEPKEVAQYFPEIRRVMDKCRFNNCMHISEPDCAVKEAVEAGTISTRRFESYLSIIRNEDVFN